LVAVLTNGKTDYLGSFIYENDELKYIQTGGGRIVVEQDTSFKREYYLTDHLGNVRVVFDTNGQVLQEDSYYPFGSTQEGLNFVSDTLSDNDLKNKYLFGGQEQDSKTGFFEYHYRQYDSWLGRWHVVDPMAEMYGTQSPYHFAGNNPINNAEVNGAFWQEAVADGIESGMDEWRKISSGSTGTRTTNRGPTTFFGSGGYYGVYGAGGYVGSIINGNAVGGSPGRGFDEYYHDGENYRDLDGNIVDWSEVEASLAENGALLDPSADNFAEQGFTGYVTSVNNEIVKLYVDGVGEFDFENIGGFNPPKEMINMAAFLLTLRQTENNGLEPLGYNSQYGGGTFTDKSYAEAPEDYATHPGKKITKWRQTSTAAGAYQFLKGVWKNLSDKYGFTDFSPDSQDKAAIALIVENRAYNYVVSGDFDRAVGKLSHIWTSLGILSIDKTRKLYNTNKTNLLNFVNTINLRKKR
jgi:RHS repeat-associated protein